MWETGKDLNVKRKNVNKRTKTPVEKESLMLTILRK